jgi:hypothetical protein
MPQISELLDTHARLCASLLRDQQRAAQLAPSARNNRPHPIERNIALIETQIRALGYAAPNRPSTTTLSRQARRDTRNREEGAQRRYFWDAVLPTATSDMSDALSRLMREGLSTATTTSWTATPTLRFSSPTYYGSQSAPSIPTHRRVDAFATASYEARRRGHTAPKLQLTPSEIDKHTPQSGYGWARMEAIARHFKD